MNQKILDLLERIALALEKANLLREEQQEANMLMVENLLKEAHGND